MKLNSLADAIPTPNTIGIKDKYTEIGKTFFVIQADIIAATTGSKALTTCANDTDPEPYDITLAKLPRPTS